MGRAGIRWGIVIAIVFTGTSITTLAPTPTLAGSQCMHGTQWRVSQADADLIMRGVYPVDGHPLATLGLHPTWRENPRRDSNWAMRFNALLFTKHLVGAWASSGKPIYLKRFKELLQSWYSANPRTAPTTRFAWADHSTAWRAMTFACAYEILPHEPWLVRAMREHAYALADDTFYVHHGNHALDQDLGLLAIGCELKDQRWIHRAASRITTLFGESVDDQGVTNEGSIEYEAYNYFRYGEAVDRLRACRQQTPSLIARRRALMPAFLAAATNPLGRYEMIGDTKAERAAVLVGTPTEFTGTRGARGLRPATTFDTFRAGYAFGRSGFGEHRAYTDETYYSARFGSASRIHGHADLTAMTMFSYGLRLLVDPGMYRYENDAFRGFFKGPRAHNIVVPDGGVLDPAGHVDLIHHEHARSHDLLVMRGNVWRGIRTTRSIYYSRTGDFFVVRDELISPTPRTYNQLWHLMSGTAPRASGLHVQTDRARSNVLIRWIGAAPSLKIVTGARHPIQGWISYRYGTLVPAPTIIASKRGTDVRFLTLLVPFATQSPQVEILGSSQSTVRLRVGTHTETIALR